MDLGHPTDLGVEPTPGTGRIRPHDARDVVILRWPDEADARDEREKGGGMTHGS